MVWVVLSSPRSVRLQSVLDLLLCLQFVERAAVTPCVLLVLSFCSNAAIQISDPSCIIVPSGLDKVWYNVPP